MSVVTADEDSGVDMPHPRADSGKNILKVLNKNFLCPCSLLIAIVMITKVHTFVYFHCCTTKRNLSQSQLNINATSSLNCFFLELI